MCVRLLGCWLIDLGYSGFCDLVFNLFTSDEKGWDDGRPCQSRGCIKNEYIIGMYVCRMGDYSRKKYLGLATIMYFYVVFFFLFFFTFIFFQPLIIL